MCAWLNRFFRRDLGIKRGAKRVLVLPVPASYFLWRAMSKVAFITVRWWAGPGYYL